MHMYTCTKARHRVAGASAQQGSLDASWIGCGRKPCLHVCTLQRHGEIPPEHHPFRVPFDLTPSLSHQVRTTAHSFYRVILVLIMCIWA